MTSDDDSDDLFMPIRRSSGYLRFVDTSSLVATITPTGMRDRFVEVCSGQTVVWCGFLSPQNFESPWAAVTEAELPMVGALNVLDSILWPTTNNGIYSFGYVIRDTLYQLFADYDYITHIYFPHHLGTPTNFIDLQLQGGNFLTTEDNDNGTAQLTSTRSYADVLSSICNLFGLQMHIIGRKLYFTDYPVSQTQDPSNVGTFYFVTAAAFNAHVTSGTAITFSTTHTVTTHSLASLSIRGTNNSFGSLLGRRRCTFSASIGEYDNILSLPSDKAPHLCKAATVNTFDNSALETPTRFYWRSNVLSSETAHTLGNDTTILSMPPRFTSALEGTPAVQIGSCPLDEVTSKTSYDWTNGIHIRVIGDNNTTFTRTRELLLKSRVAVSIQGGMLYFNAKLKNNSIDWMQVMLKIGSKYWNGTTWTTVFSTFRVNTKAANGTDTELADTVYPSIPSGSNPDTHYDGVFGYAIELYGNTFLQGVAELSILYVHSQISTPKPYQNVLTDLTLNFQRAQTDSSFVLQSPNTYNPSFQPDYTFSTDLQLTSSIASDRANSIGRGHVLFSSGSFFSTYYFLRSGTGGSSGSAHPEAEVIDGAARYYSRRLKTIRATVSTTNDAHPTSVDLLTDLSSNRMAIVSVTRDYIRDESTIYCIAL